MLDPLLVLQEHFEFFKGTFHRALPSLLSHLIVVDMNRSRETFWVICGLNSSVLTGDVPPNEMGMYHSRYLTKVGLQISSRDWNCRNDALATESLQEVAEATERFALPWFSLHQTLASFAAEMSDDQDYLKGRLYLKEGNIGSARANFEHYLRRLELMPATEDVQQAKDEMQRILQGL